MYLGSRTDYEDGLVLGERFMGKGSGSSLCTTVCCQDIADALCYETSLPGSPVPFHQIWPALVPLGARMLPMRIPGIEIHPYGHVTSSEAAM
jgi:hypothetical protein